ncbi:MULTISPECIES: spermidine/putrescine ABC transporter substrate-binding protein [Streptomyces]|uniref:Spermidine/putrescine ABC transporter substrate-binding protein n=1 Tax=Streptomyces poriferorum TaxID=2798799 RepID=A0ABY9IL52_9ACTN|nr:MULTISPECIES: spermidine/putrescine ABC transporter substrate-binding protein [Streptomyces]MBW5248990.1 spermidine/putrescine ABC transporter substrate-binding protein [Streptomyces poriferorum]MBW5257057.1 spermidine/putrescine ABC transporter substrate-binding protein [Streptomyces poriferorum]MDP5315097.1 spermidine/putrescine ABC transporter substrate-binding protein [Streptomyces sp. Alt4]WLQ56032.1 spermidine/putrescine ABC transporter substrate-binding protein [Streptomyces sp. Alt2]
MEQYEPERLSAAQLAAMRRSLTNGRGALTRRSLLRASGMGALAIGGLGTLSACGIPPAKREGDAAAASDDHSAKEKQVNFSNWTEYMDVSEDEKHRPTLEAFTERTGIKVKYTEDINDNVEFFGKIKPQLAAGQDTGRDLIIVTDWLAARIIRLGWAQKLDPANLPHAFANLSPQFRTPDWDPGRAYSYPWTGIPTVIAYNSKATGGRKVDSVTQLLDDPTLKGRVAFLSEMRDSVGMTLLDMGKDPGKFTDADYDAAIGRMQKGVDKNQIRRFTGNDYTADLDKGDIAACVAWAGDIIQLQAGNPDIKFAIPAAGYITSSDNMLVPAKARHKTNAEKLMDYYYEPPVAAQLAAYINYVCPVDGVREELARIDKAMAANTLILPDKAMAARSHAFRSLTAEEETAYEEKFAKLIGA